MTETTLTKLQSFDAEVLEKIAAASESYKSQMKQRNGRSGFDFELWLKFATLLVTFEDFLVDAGIEDTQSRDQILRIYMGTARSTARRHRQIYNLLHLIPNAEQYKSWKELHRAAVAVSN